MKAKKPTNRKRRPTMATLRQRKRYDETQLRFAVALCGSLDPLTRGWSVDTDLVTRRVATYSAALADAFCGPRK